MAHPVILWTLVAVILVVWSGPPAFFFWRWRRRRRLESALITVFPLGWLLFALLIVGALPVEAALPLLLTSVFLGALADVGLVMSFLRQGRDGRWRP